jgi:tRNA-2-methylthio-N6-dimethylallyladenosine synthase
MSSTTTPKRAYVETYGCQMNISDGELMQGVLAEAATEIVDAPEDADVVLVNTCAIREHAEQRVLGRVSQLNGLKRERPGPRHRRDRLHGAAHGRPLLEDAPYVDLVMGPDGYRSLPDALRAAAGCRRRSERRGGPRARRRAPPDAERGAPQLAVLDLNLGENYDGLEQRRADGPSAWIPIQRGCDHRCTYCIVPYVRGPRRTGTPRGPRRGAGARRAGRHGGHAAGPDRELVRAWRLELSRGSSGPWLASTESGGSASPRRTRTTSRPSSSEVMAVEPAVCEQLHLPAQSGSNRTLKRMLRRYTVESLPREDRRVRARSPTSRSPRTSSSRFPARPRRSSARPSISCAGPLRRGVHLPLLAARRHARDPASRRRTSSTPRRGRPGSPSSSRSAGASRRRSTGPRWGASRRSSSRRPVGTRPDLGRTRRNKVVVFDGERGRIGGYAHVELEHTTGATFTGRKWSDAR